MNSKGLFFLDRCGDVGLCFQNRVQCCGVEMKKASIPGQNAGLISNNVVKFISCVLFAVPLVQDKAYQTFNQRK